MSDLDLDEIEADAAVGLTDDRDTRALVAEVRALRAVLAKVEHLHPIEARVLDIQRVRADTETPRRGA